MARDNTPDMSGFGYIDLPRGGQAGPTHDDVVAAAMSAAARAARIVLPTLGLLRVGQGALPRQRRNRIFFPLPKLPILQIPF